MAGHQSEQSGSDVGRRRKPNRNSLNRTVINYLIAIAAPGLALVWRLGMIRYLGHDLPVYITFYPAVMVAAIVAGLGAGLIATAMSALLAMYWVLPPYGFAIANRADAVGLVLFAGMGVFVSVVAEHYGRVRQRAADYKQELAKLENERQFRVLADAMPQLAWMANSDGWIFWYNQRWYQYTGTTPEQMEGWGWQSVHDPAMLPVVLERWNASIGTGEPFDMVFPLRGAGGEFHPFLTRVMPVKDGEGKVVRWFGTNTDISEQKRAEAQLQRLNRILKALNNSNQAMLKATDEAELLEKVCGIVTEDCGHAMVWIGFAENDEGKAVRPVAHSGFEDGYLETLGITWADTERGRGPTGTAIRTGQPSVCRNMFTDPNFEPWRAEALNRGYASSAVVPLISEGKGFGAITIYSREPETFSEDEIKLLMELAGDLSQGISAIRMRAAHANAVEELRRVSEQRRLALEAAKLGAWDYRFDTGEVFWDERCRNMWGVRTGGQVDYGEAIARIHVDDRAATDEAVKQAIAGTDGGAYHREFRVVWPDGSVHWISSNGRVYFEGEGDECRAVRFIGVNIDTTERMQAEEKLHEHREWLRVTLTSIGDAVMTSDAQGRVTFLNPVAETLTGWKTEEALGQPIQSVFRIINEQTGEPASDIVGQVLRERRVVALANHTALVTKDGIETPIEDSAAPIMDAAGEVTGVVLVFHDVTDRRAAQESLRQNEERLRFHFENTPLAVVEWGADFRLSKWSGEAERIFGWRAEEVLGKRLDEFRWVYEEDAAKVAETSVGLLDGSRPRSVSQNRNYRKDGSVVHCEWYNSSLLDASGKLASILSLVLDITDRKQAQEALIRNEKLASVGRMAASIAHEINNPLAAVMNTLYLAKNSEGTTASVREYLDIADEELKRVSHITRQALGFYRESSVPAEVSVSAILDSAVDVLQSRIKAKGAKIEKQYDKDLQITAVGGELRQVFSNLLLNSIEAVGENGVIKLRAGRSRITGDGDAGVRITVADNGKGIEPSLRSRVFEPLFTTKDATGTGLGLWVTKQIVEKHGGSIRFRSRAVGKSTGTVFSVVIPAKAEGLGLSKACAAASS
jgi:PAS domain S-box-containing protein